MFSKKKSVDSELLDLINYLTYETDNYAVGAHLCGSTDVNGAIADFKEMTGKEPAYLDYDMHSLPFRQKSEIENAVNELADFTARGGFITLTDHWLVPTIRLSDASEGGAANSRYALTKEQYQDVMTDGTELNANFTAELDIKAEFIKELAGKNVEVIYRPMHEANGSWFWWGVNQENGITMSDVRQLYIYVYNYFTLNHGIDNILWAFSDSLLPGETNYEWYPGNRYVDIMTVDWYASADEINSSSSYFFSSYFEESQKFGKKPFAVAEFGGDGTYSADTEPLTKTLSAIDSQIAKGAKVAYVGLYFNYGAQDGTLPDTAITLDEMPGYRDENPDSGQNKEWTDPDTGDNGSPDIFD